MSSIKLWLAMNKQIYNHKIRNRGRANLSLQRKTVRGRKSSEGALRTWPRPISVPSTAARRAMVLRVI